MNSVLFNLNHNIYAANSALRTTVYSLVYNFKGQQNIAILFNNEYDTFLCRYSISEEEINFSYVRFSMRVYY